VLRRLADLGAEPAESETDDNILTRILGDRATGARALLPTTEVSPPRSNRLVITAGAVMVGVIAVISLLSIRNASAGSRTGSLSFDPAAPRPGQTVRVTYEPNAALSRFDSVVLRTRFRKPVDEDYNAGMRLSRVGVMRRSGGRFTLEFRLPDSVVFAVFAVESPGADVVDDNDDQLWELVTADDTGKPLFDALVQKQRDMMGRNWEGGLRTARELAALYPDDPQAGSIVTVFERWVLGDRIADSLLPSHRRRFAALQSALSEKPGLPVRTLSGMEWFAIALDDSAASRFWRERLQRGFPNDPEVLFREENALADQYIKTQKDPRGFYRVLETRSEYFQKMEPLWQRAEPTHDRTLRSLALNAYGHAMEAKDTAALRVWASRFRQWDRDRTEMDAWLGKELLPYPTLRDTAKAWLRDGVRRLAGAPDAYRGLTLTVAEQQHRNRAAAQPILATLGSALIEDGQTAAGLDTLRLAASYGWDAEVLRSIARALLARGDTNAALQSYARVVADPGTPATLRDSIDAIVTHAGAGNWAQLVSNATQEMRQSVLQRAAPRSLSGPVRFMTRSGETRRLTEVVSNQVTVLMLWSPYCVPSMERLHDLDLLRERLAPQGVQVVTVVDQPFSKDLEQALRVQRAGQLPVLYDFRGDARRAFTSFGTPDYYVLDSSGRLMFAHSRLEELPRQVAALLPADSSAH
jgi:hypothetical protein